ncbi:MAG TPA: DUF2141 domain-containing protein [Allosphingosinicella sp.]
MSKAGLMTAGAAAMMALQPVAATAAVGPDAAACRARSGRTALIVNVRGFRTRTGNLRVAAYGSDPADFLARGRWVRRIDLPVARSGPMPVCVALPRPGRYAIAVRHDENGDGHSDWGDGGGFSRNPALAFPNPRPTHAQAAINVPSGVHGTDIVLNYRTGLHIGPVTGGGR